MFYINKMHINFIASEMLSRKRIHGIIAFIPDFVLTTLFSHTLTAVFYNGSLF